MSWTSYPNVLILTALILCIDLELSTAFKECSITEITGQYYSKKASNGSGEILKTLESKNKSDCWRNCCELERCNFMMYSTVLKKQGSSNVTCFLFRCSEITKCKTLLLPRNSNGISIIGVKQENITEANPGSSEDVVQHKIYKLLLNSSVHSSKSGIAITSTTINTDKPENVTLKFNKTINIDKFGVKTTIQSPSPKNTHSPSSSANLTTQGLVESISNNNYPTSMVTSSQSNALEILTWFNHSFSIHHPFKSTHNSSHSTLSSLIHSTRSSQTHTLGNRSSQTHTFGNRSSQTHTFGNRSLQTHTLGNRSSQTHTFGNRSSQTHTFGNRSSQTHTLGNWSSQTHTLGNRSSQTHTLGNRSRSNGSSSHNVGWLSGSYSNPNAGAHSFNHQTHSLNKISHTLSSISVGSLVNSLQSNPDSEVVMTSLSSFVRSHHSAETMLLSTIPSLDATSNISHVSQLDAPSNLHKNHHTRSTSSPIASHSSNSVHKTHRKFSEQKSHTTRVSLVISLIFGIFFFGTVVFIIGRRWSEQCFRRGYSRVDYLLNDYD
ncbi:uncharacterized protein LOC114531698 isoform X1 [Dendronephthya gigantea]|uniref:uncharacterized protein LOC114531698 isoform X1 n=1 Tax=Dendronephthya gigantea TaxID=151771 RepID=UPI00106A3077|nr:uncharacterized protein LOC114531698 isoform X1 [Dendronephthya gigantea]